MLLLVGFSTMGIAIATFKARDLSGLLPIYPAILNYLDPILWNGVTHLCVVLAGNSVCILVDDTCYVVNTEICVPFCK